MLPLQCSEGAIMAIGPKVLVIEDEPLIAIELETIMLELGCVCIGPVMTTWIAPSST